jgi:hypothetical protein
MPSFSEDAFLARLLPRLASDIPVPPGDDCAAIPWREGTLLLLAVDQVAEAEVPAHLGYDMANSPK